MADDFAYLFYYFRCFIFFVDVKVLNVNTIAAFLLPPIKKTTTRAIERESIVTDARIISIFKFKCPLLRHKYSMSNQNKGKKISFVNISHTIQGHAFSKQSFSVRSSLKKGIYFLRQSAPTQPFLFTFLYNKYSQQKCHACQISFKWKQK